MFNSNSQIRGFPIAILATPSGRQLATVVDRQLQEIFKENGEQAPPTFLRESDNPRFQNGEGKAVIVDSIRGTDLFIIVDIGNYGVTYQRYDTEVTMGPDEHFQDLKRQLGAAKNMAQRVTVIMPLLYESRQHKMYGRESLDCALALQELVNLGVDSFMTIDAHNSHVMNAIPRHGLENLHGAYQLIECMLQDAGDQIKIHPDSFVLCSPDLGGMERARYFAEHFQVHLTGFYKYRDLTRIIDGKNPVIEHKFLGDDLTGKDVLVVDDMLASGGSLLETATELRDRHAKGVYFAVTYALFSGGVAAFDKAYEDGLFNRLYATNATYIPPELLEREWFVVADATRFIAKFIHSFNQDHSITRLLDSTEKINKLLGRELMR